MKRRTKVVHCYKPAKLLETILVMKTGIVLLAAGSSLRLGSPKQLLQYQGRSFISRAAQTALRSNADIVTVVIGGYAAAMFHEMEQLPVRIVFNKNFNDGMASSISSGVRAVELDDLDAIVLMVCDQPSVSAALINSLISKGMESEDSIAASAYAGAIGTPVFFDRKYLPDLLQLKGQEGAKKILTQYADKVITVPFPEGAIDIDTAEDYEKLLEHSH
jgi:molybdenum cofactor cytidylyltransferase